MNKCTAIIQPDTERGREWLHVYGTNEIAIQSFAPQLASVPGQEEGTLVYMLDLAALTPEQRARLIKHLSEKFEIPAAEVERDLDKGVPILAEDVTVKVSLSPFALIGYREPLGLPYAWQDE